MNNKIRIIIAIIVIILILILFNSLNGNNATEEGFTDTEIDLSNVQYNEETGEYYITDENGEVTHTAESEEGLYIYTIDPDYDPKLPASDTENSADEVE